tara:strand:+ start:7043 stop:7843 length:801 start_codon:yes stop_codon:yes gene_type:complete
MQHKNIQPFPGAVKDCSSVRLDLCTWPEVEEYLAICKAIIVPIGSTEQHGPTGAIGTDAFTAEAIAIELARRTGVLVTPVQSFGMAEHHLGFPGTMSLRPSTLIQVIKDLVLSLAKNGFEKIYFVNGHGGNIATVKSAFHEVYSSALNQKITSASSLRCKIASWFLFKEVSNYANNLYGNLEGQHATPSEISLTLYLHPTLMKKQKPLPSPPLCGPINNFQDFRFNHPDGRMGSDPFLAKPNHGKLFLDMAVNALIDDLSNFLNYD